MSTPTMTKKQIKTALKFGKKHGLVIVPTKEKRPQAGRGWQKLSESYYEDYGWSKATGFGIVSGKASGITVIDVDDDMDWFKMFWDKYELEPTTRVCTPSGGLHLYFKHDPRLKQTQGFNGLSIDVRNDGGYIMAPGYVDRKSQSHKIKYIGKNYEFDCDDDGKLLDFSRMRKLDEIFIRMQLYGIDKETMELLPPKEVKKQKISKDVTNGREIIGDETEPETNQDYFMEYVIHLGKKHGSNGAWYEKWTNMLVYLQSCT